MSYTPIDRFATLTQNSFDTAGVNSRSEEGDRMTGGHSGEITWSDVQRTLWAPPAVQPVQARSESSPAPEYAMRSDARELLKIQLQDLQTQQTNLEQTVKTALSLQVESLEAKEHVPHKFPHLPVLDAFHSSDCKLSHTFLPDGTSRTVQTAPDGSTRTQVRSPDGLKEAKVADRYGRPVLVEMMNQDGSWSISEMTYPDANGKMSPFVSSKRITQSDGTVVEVDFSWHGKVTRRHEYNV